MGTITDLPVEIQAYIFNMCPDFFNVMIWYCAGRSTQEIICKYLQEIRVDHRTVLALPVTIFSFIFSFESLRHIQGIIFQIDNNSDLLRIRHIPRQLYRISLLSSEDIISFLCGYFYSLLLANKDNFLKHAWLFAGRTTIEGIFRYLLVDNNTYYSSCKELHSALSFFSESCSCSYSRPVIPVVRCMWQEGEFGQIVPSNKKSPRVADIFSHIEMGFHLAGDEFLLALAMQIELARNGQSKRFRRWYYAVSRYRASFFPDQDLVPLHCIDTLQIPQHNIPKHSECIAEEEEMLDELRSFYLFNRDIVYVNGVSLQLRMKRETIHNFYRGIHMEDICYKYFCSK